MLQLDSVVIKTTFPWQSRRSPRSSCFPVCGLLRPVLLGKWHLNAAESEVSVIRAKNPLLTGRGKEVELYSWLKATEMTSSIVKLRDSIDVITTWFHLLTVLYSMIVQFLSKFSPVASNPSFTSSCVNLDHVFTLEPSTAAQIWAHGPWNACVHSLDAKEYSQP